MKSEIYVDKILFLNQHNDTVYIIAENDNSEIVFLTKKQDKICQKGILNVEFEQVTDIALNFQHNLLGFTTNKKELHIYKFSNHLLELKTKSASIKGEYVEFSDSGNFLCSYNSSKVTGIWHNNSDEWIKCKIKQSDYLGLFNKFSNTKYYFKKEGDKFNIITPDTQFEIQLDKNKIDKILKNKLFCKREKTQDSSDLSAQEEEIITKCFDDQSYALKVFNKETNILAGVEERENRIDIWKVANENYTYLSTLDKHCGIVKSLCFSNDGQILISGSVTNEIKIWSFIGNNFKVKQTLRESKIAIIDLKISDDNRTFISLDRRKKLIIWKLHSKTFRSGKKKKRIVREEFYNFTDIDDFSYRFELLTINNESLIINVKEQSFVLFDLNLKEFKNTKEIETALISNKSELSDSLIHKNENSDDYKTQERLEISKRESQSLNSDRIEQVEIISEEDKKITEEIKQFRNNISKPLSSSKKKSFLSPIRRKTTEVVNIIVGLDFGTSNTKVAYRRLSTDQVKPIIFNHNLQNHENYFLPSIIVFDNEGSLKLGLEAAEYLENEPSKKGIFNFKMLFVSEIDRSLKNNSNIKLMKQNLKNEFPARILERFNEKKYRFLVIAYLVYSMRKTREKIALDLPNRQLNISFNVCIPVDYINNNNISYEFNWILATAEFIEREYYEKHIDFDFIDLVHKNIKYDEFNTRIFDIPETVAEVASYTTSSSLKKGLHALLDFGAGTTDISIFNIKNPRESNQKFSFYSSNIINYGFRKVDSLKEMNRKNEIKDYIHFLWEKSNIAWQEAYDNHLKNEDYWKGDKVQVFISGGGANEQLVKSIFCKPRVNKQKWEAYKHPLKVLPTPEDYNYKDIPFHRFAVAYGLANPKPKLNIKDFVLPKDAADDTPKLKVKKIYKWAEDRVPTKDFV